MEFPGCGFIGVDDGLALGIRGEVAFVDGDEGTAVLDCGEETTLFVVEGLSGIEYDEDDSGVGEGLARALDAELFDLFQGIAEARGVDELEGNAVKGDPLGDEVAGGAWDGCNDGAIALDEAVEEGAFAGVGAADDGDSESVVNNAASGEGGFEGGERRDEFVDAAGDFGLGSYVDVVFGEVDAGF